MVLSYRVDNNSSSTRAREHTVLTVLVHRATVESLELSRLSRGVYVLLLSTRYDSSITQDRVAGIFLAQDSVVLEVRDLYES